jgi:putative transposase
MIYPLVRELAVDGIPLAVTCRVLKIARQPYYRWLAAPVTARDLVAAYRADALFDAHRDDPEFGYSPPLDNGMRPTAVARDSSWCRPDYVPPPRSAKSRTHRPSRVGVPKRSRGTHR